LLQAVVHGHTNIVQTLLEHQAHRNHQERDGWSALMFAAHNGHTNIVRLLLSYGVDLGLRTKFGQTAYQLAVASHQVEVSTLLEEALQSTVGGMADEVQSYVHEVDVGKEFGLVQDTSLDPANREDTIDLLEAVRLGDLAAVAFNLQAGADVNAVDGRGFPPVSLAAAAGHVEVLSSLLLHEGVDVNLVENDGWSPLMFAAYTGKVDSVKLLLEKGANPYLRSRSGANATEIASNKNHPEVVKLINNNGLKRAINDKDVPRIKQMLLAGADPDISNEKGLTALIVVLSKDTTLEDVQYVLSYGASVNLEEQDGWSPLHFAAFYGILPVAEHLILAGANCSSKTKSGYLSEVYADSRGHSEVVALLQKCRESEQNGRYQQLASLSHTAPVNHQSESVITTPATILHGNVETESATELVQAVDGARNTGSSDDTVIDGRVQDVTYELPVAVEEEVKQEKEGGKVEGEVDRELYSDIDSSTMNDSNEGTDKATINHLTATAIQSDPVSATTDNVVTKSTFSLHHPMEITEKQHEPQVTTKVMNDETVASEITTTSKTTTGATTTGATNARLEYVRLAKERAKEREKVQSNGIKPELERDNSESSSSTSSTSRGGGGIDGFFTKLFRMN